MGRSKLDSVRVVTPEVPRVAPVATGATPEPYRVLFPIGVLLGVAGAAVWPLYVLRGVAYPGAAHRVLMIEGFQTSFILGFLLTAMKGLLRAERCGPRELGAAAASALACGLLVLAGRVAAAHVAFLAALIVLVAILGRRFARRAGDPAEEFAFVAFGLLQGLVGAAMLVLISFGVPAEPSGGLGVRLVSLGMVLSLVLGLGGLLVPTFAGIPKGLEIPRIAEAHERRGRRTFYLAVLAVLVASVAADIAGATAWAAWLRAIAATPMLVLVWKVFSPGGHRTVPAAALRLAGLFVLCGVWVGALWPMSPLLGFHLIFMGGFGVLTLAIGTRVVVAHGGHPPAAEASTLNPTVLACLVIAVFTRLLAEMGGAARDPLLAASGSLWALAWLLWAVRAVPMIVRLAPGK